MTLNSTRERLSYLLSNDDVKVIALTGKWGTGKSHMWTTLERSSSEERVKNALYVSLFGLTSIDGIKSKLVQNAAPSLERNKALLKSTKAIYGGAVKVLEGFHKGFAALNGIGEIAMLVAPAVLRERLIVLDDIERKHDQLNIEEILGFIDEYVQRYRARFLLILNSDRLTNKEIWETLREKVIEEELRLQTTSREAFDIAIERTPSRWKEVIAPVVEACGLTNIRIVTKVIKAVNSLLGDREQISQEVLQRVVPSTVLLAAIHYKGIENGPDAEYVLTFGRDSDDFDYDDAPPTVEAAEPVKPNPLYGKWAHLLRSIGIYFSDEYEVLVAESLESGLYDTSEVANVLDKFEAQKDVARAGNLLNHFLQLAYWEHRLSDSEVLKHAEPLIRDAHLLDAMGATAFHDSLKQISGGEPAAAAVIAHWVRAHRGKVGGNLAIPHPFLGKPHPEIEALFMDSEQRAVTAMSAVDTCRKLMENNGWGAREQVVLRSASASDFELLLRTSNTEDLRILLAKMVEIASSPAEYEQPFGSAGQHFSEACRQIVKDESVPKLAKLIRSVFDSCKAGKLLADDVSAFNAP